VESIENWNAISSNGKSHALPWTHQAPLVCAPIRGFQRLEHVHWEVRVGRSTAWCRRNTITRNGAAGRAAIFPHFEQFAHLHTADSPMYMAFGIQENYIFALMFIYLFSRFSRNSIHRCGNNCSIWRIRRMWLFLILRKAEESAWASDSSAETPVSYRSSLFDLSTGCSSLILFTLSRVLENEVGPP
jgi:hypothetical protein